MELRHAAGHGRYAHLEREQRWLLPGRPAAAVNPVSIVDIYLTGTRLRLRRAESQSAVLYKLGQKVRLDEHSPAEVKLTNMYLSEPEYDTLRHLPGQELRKTRWHLAAGRRRVAVDEFHAALTGLVLAEVELAADEPTLAPPVPAARDVSTDDRFSGGRLAGMTANQLAELLAAMARP